VIRNFVTQYSALNRNNFPTLAITYQANHCCLTVFVMLFGLKRFLPRLKKTFLKNKSRFVQRLTPNGNFSVRQTYNVSLTFTLLQSLCSRGNQHFQKNNEFNFCFHRKNRQLSFTFVKVVVLLVLVVIINAS